MLSIETNHDGIMESADVLQGRLHHRDNLLYIAQLMKTLEILVIKYLTRIYTYFFYPCLIYCVLTMVYFVGR